MTSRLNPRGYVLHPRPPAGRGHAPYRCRARGFPDLHAELAGIVAEGDRVAMRVVITGTHSGPFFGNQPSGRPVSIEQFYFVRVNADGRAIRHWANVGLDDMLRQIGADQTGSRGPVSR